MGTSKINFDQYKISDQDNKEHKSSKDIINFDQYKIADPETSDTFLGKIPKNLIENIKKNFTYTTPPKNLPEFKFGSPENKNLLENMINSFSGTPGINVINPNVSKSILQRIMQNPLIKTTLRGLIGAGAGYEITGGWKGATTGAALGVTAPKLINKLGIGSKNPGTGIVEKITPQEAQATSERLASAERLGTPITPGEASARPDLTAEEANIGRSSPASTERVKIGQERISQQKKAIEDLNNKISSSGEVASFDVRKAARDSIKSMEDERQKAVYPLYKVAHKEKVSPNLVTKLEKENPVISEAIDSVLADKKYQVEGELLNEPRNSIKTLDYAKRYIDKLIEQAKNFGDSDGVRVLTATKNKLLKSIDGFSSDYKAARAEYNKLSEPIDKIKDSQIGRIANMKDTQLKGISKTIFNPAETDIETLKEIKSNIQQQDPEAWNKIIRNEMNRLMTQGKGGQINARSFYDKVLANPNRYHQFEEALSDNPEALSHLKDMKTAWEHIINIETPRTAAGASKTSMSKARESVQAFIDHYNEMFGGDKQIKALKYLYSDQWKKDLNFISKFKKPSERLLMLEGIISKSISPAYMIYKDKND